jgi:predicted metal-dependent hydrolase
LKPNTVATLNIDSDEINYKIRRSSRAKYLQLRISSNGVLELILPQRAGLTDGQHFINNKKDWVKKHLHLLKKEEDQMLFLGKPLTIHQEFHLFGKKHHFKELPDNTLLVSSPEGSSITINEFYKTYLRVKAKKYLPEWTLSLANKYNFNPKRITIKGHKTRWGSCSGKGNINFNYKLMQFSREVIEYVIIHELCHLRQLNHSKLFWDEVAKYSPRYQTLRRQLKKSIM